jgi:hypothetical protein
MVGADLEAEGRKRVRRSIVSPPCQSPQLWSEGGSKGERRRTEEEVSKPANMCRQRVLTARDQELGWHRTAGQRPKTNPSFTFLDSEKTSATPARH